MRRISKLALAVGIAAALVAAAPAAAAPRYADASPSTAVLRVLDWVLDAVLGNEKDAGHSIDPDGLAADSGNASNTLDEGHSIDPNG